MQSCSYYMSVFLISKCSIIRQTFCQTDGVNFSRKTNPHTILASQLTAQTNGARSACERICQSQHLYGTHLERQTGIETFGRAVSRPFRQCGRWNNSDNVQSHIYGRWIKLIIPDDHYALDHFVRRNGSQLCSAVLYAQRAREPLARS